MSLPTSGLAFDCIMDVIAAHDDPVSCFSREEIAGAIVARLVDDPEALMELVDRYARTALAENAESPGKARLRESMARPYSQHSRSIRSRRP